MANDGFKVKNKLNIKPSTTAGDTEGDIRVDGSGNLRFRDGSTETTVLDSTNTVTATNKTFTSPVLDGTISGTGVLDEDNMASDSNTAIPTQQSVKAYVDSVSTDLSTHEADTTTHGTTGDIVGTSDTQVLSNKSTSDSFTVGGQVLTSTGTAAAPSMSFSSDPDTGFFNGSDNINVSLGGTKGAAFTKSTSGYTNFGVGLYSTVDTVPFYLLRSHNTTTGIQVVNQTTGTGANVNIGLETGTASATKGMLALYSTGTSLTSLADRLAVRSRTGSGVSICAEDTGGDIRHYIEGFYAADEYQRFGMENVTFTGSGTISPDSTLAFEVTGTTTRGSKPAPTLTEAQRDAISTPATGSIVYNSDSDKYNYYNGASWTELGSGGGSGGKNYFTNSDFESGIGLATAYDDTGAYVDGTGGSPTAISISQNSTTPLRGTNDLKITKAASDGSGEGVTLLSESIERADQGRQLYFKAEVDFSDANYTSGDVCVKAYDVAGAAELAVVPVSGLDSNGCLEQGKGKVLAKILTTSSTTGAVRVSLHLESDSATASAWSAYVDDVELSPQGTVPGAIITKPVAFTPTFTNFTIGSGTVDTAVWWREGEYMLGEVKVTLSGSTMGTGILIDVPNGESIDTAQVPSGFQVGSSILFDSGSAYYHGISVVSSATQIQLRYLGATTSVDQITSTAPMTWANSDQFQIKFKVPISGWEASAALSTTEVFLGNPDVRGEGNGGGALTANVTNIDFTETADNTNSFDGTTFTAPKAGRYKIAGSVLFTASVTGRVDAYINTVQDRALSTNVSLNYRIISGDVYLDKGDALTIRFNGTATLSNSTLYHYISVSKIPDDLSYFSVYGETEAPSAGTDTYGAVSGTAGQWHDASSITLNAGEYDVTYLVEYFNNGAATTQELGAGISETAGNNAPSGAGKIVADYIPSTTQYRSSIGTTFNGYAVNGPTTLYLKARVASNNTNLQYRYHISARKVK